MVVTRTIDTDVGQIHVGCTDASDGDFSLSVEDEQLNIRRSSLVSEPWTWLRQVHGTSIVEATFAGQHAGAEADGALTTAPNVPVAVLTADCAPLALISSSGLAVLHCGWRGVMAGIVERATEKLNHRGAHPVSAVLGPCIHPAAYEFSAEDLKPIINQFGIIVQSETVSGRPALDLPALVAEACRRQGWGEVTPIEGQTVCTSGSSYFSHRTRADAGRQTMVGWIEE